MRADIANEDAMVHAALKFITTSRHRNIIAAYGLNLPSVLTSHAGVQIWARERTGYLLKWQRVWFTRLSKKPSLIHCHSQQRMDALTSYCKS